MSVMSYLIHYFISFTSRKMCTNLAIFRHVDVITLVLMRKPFFRMLLQLTITDIAVENFFQKSGNFVW